MLGSETEKSGFYPATDTTAFERSAIKQPLSLRKIAFLLLFLDLVGFGLFYNLFFYLLVRDYDHPLTLFWMYTWKSALTVSALYILDAYKPVSHVSGLGAPTRALVGVFIASMFIAIAVYVVDSNQIPVKGYRSLTWAALACFSVWAYFWRLTIGRVYANNSAQVRWLVLGDQECLEEFGKEFLKKHHRLQALTVLSEDGRGVNLAQGGKTALLQSQGSWGDVDAFLSQAWSGIVIASRATLPSGLLEKLMVVRLKGVRVYDLTDFYERFWLKLPVFHLKTGWFAISHGFDLLHNNFGWRIKRVMDILLSALLSLPSFPLMAVVALFIKIESRGPVFFKQQRVGRNKKVFTLYKFRTMHDGSEKGSKYTAVNDKRITFIGGILRKTRLDELPQVWNVLRGDMSLIGPRAEWTECVKDYEHVIPFYHFRHLVKPGITGWAQVLYPYGVSVADAEEKLAYDLYYIKNYSFLLDLAIIFRTVRVMLFGKGL